MFRIEIFVDDRKLSYVLWALSGHILEMKPPQPVANAQVRNGKLRAKTSGNRVEMLMQHLRERKITEMKGPSMIREFCVANGLSEKSYSNVLDNALKAKVLTRRKLGKGTSSSFIYTVAKGA
jgi:hypothetical protein